MKKLSTIFLLTFFAITTSYGQEIIEMKKENGVYTIPCMVNDLKLRFIFDTGAVDVSISAMEAGFMLKNGYLSETDFTDSQQYILADGSIQENAIINIKELKIGSIVLTNIKACVSSNLSAPLLLGQSAISQLGKWHIDSNRLYLGADSKDISNENMTDEECYEKAMAYSQSGEYDNAYNLLYKIRRKNNKYRKEFIQFVINNNYKIGLEIVAKECLNACIEGDTDIIAIVNEKHKELAPRNKEENFNFYNTLYEKVSKKYAHELASSYYDFYTPNVDEEEYIQYLENAAIECEKFSKELAAEYYYKLGFMYQENAYWSGVIEKVTDKNKCINYYKKSAILGNPNGMYGYGCLLLEKENLDSSTKDSAINWIKKAAEMNNLNAIDYLFLNYYYGDVFEQDYQSSIKYGKKILDISDNSMAILKANAYIGIMYYRMEDFDDAVSYLEIASYQNDAIKKEFPTLPVRIKNVYSILGDCYYYGDGTNKDYSKAYKLYQKEYQMDKKNTYCIWKLGYMNNYGKGTMENRELAFKYFNEGANRGDSDCQSDLAGCYYFGSSFGYPVEKDYQKAIYWSKEAIDNGDMFSYVRLGWIYCEENSTYYNVKEAVKCFQIASDNDLGLASYELGEIYEFGEGHIQKNYKLAEKYYRLALEQGYSKAEEKLSQFE